MTEAYVNSSNPGLPALTREWISQIRTRSVLVVTWAVLTIVAGQQLLGDSPDLLNYLAFYNSIGTFFDYENSRFEYGYQFFAWIAVRMGLDYFAFTTVLVSVALACKFYLFERYLASPLFAAFTYVLGFYLLHEYTQVRAAVGIGFALLGIHAMLERRWAAFAVLSLVGIFFHYSMIVMPVVALASRQIKGLPVLAAGGLVLLVGFALLSLFREPLVELASLLNPLASAYVYNDANVDTANVLSFASIMTLGIIGWKILDPNTFRKEYLRTCFGMVLASYIALILLQESLEFALRLRDALSIGLIFLVFREPLTLRQFPTVGLWFLTAAYLFYLYATSQVLT
jgi:hypothetical protein